MSQIILSRRDFPGDDKLEISDNNLTLLLAYWKTEHYIATLISKKQKDLPKGY